MNSEEFVKTHLISFALLGGIFTAVGIDPNVIIASSLLSTISSITNVSFSTLQIVLPLIFDLISIATAVDAYNEKGVVGLILVVIVFVSTALIFINAISIFVSIVAIILGPKIINILNQ